MKKVIGFVKKEAVLCVSALAAVISMLFVPPSAAYLDYIDLSVLAVLFCLMIVVAGFISQNLFGVISSVLLKRTSNAKAVSAFLVLICFFAAMLVTNDVTLITIVPFTIGILGTENAARLIFVVTMETVAANLGSMATPVGNPQNLYLYSAYNMNIGEFFAAVIPISAVSLLLIAAVMLLGKKSGKITAQNSSAAIVSKPRFIMYLALFALCLLTVLRVVDYRITLGIVAVAVFFIDRRLYARVDYSLLLTFVAFFVFVGNISAIPAVRDRLSEIIGGNEMLSGIVLSQVISNVPAAVMLSGFTERGGELLKGVDIGGLGTLVASLASLISFKQYIRSDGASAGKYLGVFTLVNVLFLAVLILYEIVF